MEFEENIIPNNDRGIARRKKKKVSLKGAVAVVLIAVILTACISSLGTVLLINLSGYNGLGLSREDWNKLKWGFNTVKEAYYGNIDEKKMIDGALLGMSLTLDEYSQYMSKEDAEAFMQSVDADSYSGVGLYIYNNIEDNTITVLSPLKNSPAEKAGVKTNDKVIAVNGITMTGADLEKATDMMLGKVGTKVKVTILKADTGETKELEFVREKIKLETVGSKILENDIGYMEITQFGVNTYDEFVTHYNDLCDKGMEKLIIDLRNNPGGYFTQAINIADIFIDKGNVIVYTMDKKGNKDEYRAVTNGIELEIVILANSGTASASEVLIGALRDYGKAVLVGEKTFGKGVTQAISEYKDGSVFKITDTKYYTPKGTCIDKTGFKPDIEAKDSDTEDLILKAGIKAFD